MADRLTQLQDAVNTQADNFCNSVGILQDMATPASLTGVVKPPVGEDHTQLFAQMVARTAKDIEVLVDSLPSEESTQELQAAGLASLEQESEQAGAALAETVKQGERLLGSIQAALHEIASKQLEMERLTAEECIVAQQSSSATL